MPRTRRQPSGPKATISGATPAPELDGLSAIIDDLLNEPRAVRLAVVLYTVAKRTENLIKDTYYPVVQAVQIEIPADPEDQKVLGGILGKCLAQRTGMIALPFEPGTEYHHSSLSPQEQPQAEAAEA